MTQTQRTLVQELANSLHEASFTPEYAEALRLDKERREQAAESGGTVEAAPDDVWSTLARYVVENAPSHVRRVIVRKLVPGLREVNLELTKQIGKAVTLFVGTKDDPEPNVIARIELQPMDPSNWTCSNCGASYPPDAPVCPNCGVK